jgi:acyl carrier protein
LTVDAQDVLRMMGEEYRALKGGGREVRASDRLGDDLDVDSIVMMELLITLEDRLEVDVVNDERLALVRTAGELAELMADAASVGAGAL